jgi:hypothetical protein
VGNPGGCGEASRSEESKGAKGMAFEVEPMNVVLVNGEKFRE